MSFQNPAQRQQDPIINHATLVKYGPKLITIKTAPKAIKGKKDPNKTYHLVTFDVDGTDHTYFIPTREIEDSLKKYVGDRVVVIASGNDKQGTATMEVQLAGKPATTLLERSESPKQEAKPETESPNYGEINAKKYLCQAANLMRLCVKKANDISIEMGLSETHRQGIATTFFIQADRNGFIKDMPISAYTPEQLGFGASKADNLKTPEAEDGE